MLPPNKKTNIQRWISDNHRQLDEAVRKRIPKSQLKSNTILNQQAHITIRLSKLPLAYHADWISLANGRRSAACRLEWARLQLFIAAEIEPLLRNKKLFHVILADKRWRVAPSKATNVSFNAVRRKVRASIQKLRDSGYNPVFVAAYEMSGDRNLRNDYAFEPHVHILINGVPKTALKAAFRVRLPRAAKLRDKPVRVTKVRAGQVGNLLGYLTKIKAQDRVEYIGKNGRANRAPNRMPVADADQWLRCMATMPIAQTVQFGGFAEPMATRFTHLEMATIIGDLA